MDTRAKTKVKLLVIASNYNKTFKTIYNEFEKNIFFKINHKEQVRDTFMDRAFPGCMPNKTFFLNATYYMRVELSQEHTRDLSDTIFSQLYPIIKDLSQPDLELMLRCVLEALSKKILLSDLLTYDDLKNIDFRDILLESNRFKKGIKEQHAGILSMLENLPQARDGLQREYNEYVESLITSRAAFWKTPDYRKKEADREIESQFVLSTIKL
jgi:hypothetical protein